MKTPINREETIGKTVGRRTHLAEDSFAYTMALQRTASKLTKLAGKGLCPRGVFKFNSHEEANEWMTKMLARPPEQTN